MDRGVVHEVEVSTRLGLRGWPGVAEDLLTQRDLLLAEYTGGRVHIAHMSTARSAGLVRRYDSRREFSGRLVPSFAASLAGDPRPDLRGFYVDYGISPDSIPRLSYLDVLTGQFDPRQVVGKAVIVGGIVSIVENENSKASACTLSARSTASSKLTS